MKNNSHQWSLKKNSLSKVKYQCKAGRRSLLFLPGFSIFSCIWDSWAQPFSMPYAWLPIPALNCFVRYTDWNSHSVQITIRAGQILRMHPCWWGENRLQNVFFRRQFLLATYQLWVVSQSLANPHPQHPEPLFLPLATWFQKQPLVTVRSQRPHPWAGACLTSLSGEVCHIRCPSLRGLFPRVPLIRCWHLGHPWYTLKTMVCHGHDQALSVLSSWDGVGFGTTPPYTHTWL